MPYETESERRLAEKRWRQRNSDGKAMQQSPPSFAHDEVAVILPDSELAAAQQYKQPVYVIRHTHLFDPEKPDWIA